MQIHMERRSHARRANKHSLSHCEPVKQQTLETRENILLTPVSLVPPVWLLARMQRECECC